MYIHTYTRRMMYTRIYYYVYTRIRTRRLYTINEFGFYYCDLLGALFGGVRIPLEGDPARVICVIIGSSVTCTHRRRRRRRRRHRADPGGADDAKHLGSDSF